MRHTLIVILLLAALAAGACSQAGPRNAGGTARNDQTAPATAPNTTTPAADGREKNQVAGDNSAPLTAANNSQNNAAAVERKIIKNATLVLDVTQPTTAQQKITAIAEAKGGFVVSTDAQQQTADGSDGSALTITVVARVPAAQFEAALTEIRATAIRVREEKQTGQDVTEEFIDLDARLKAQQALEAQFMEIMKQAKTVNDALEVQRELATVRAEIERIQGRLRFLQNQADLSTITVTISQPAPFLGSTTGFWASLKNAFSDGLWVATAILLFLVRAAVALAPVIVLIFLPIGLLWWYLVRRWRRAWIARKLAKQEMERALEAEKPPVP